MIKRKSSSFSLLFALIALTFAISSCSGETDTSTSNTFTLVGSDS